MERKQERKIIHRQRRHTREGEVRNKTEQQNIPGKKEKEKREKKNEKREKRKRKREREKTDIRIRERIKKKKIKESNNGIASNFFQL